MKRVAAAVVYDFSEIRSTPSNRRTEPLLFAVLEQSLDEIVADLCRCAF
jgi:hypothetical protein